MLVEPPKLRELYLYIFGGFFYFMTNGARKTARGRTEESGKTVAGGKLTGTGDKPWA